MAPKCSWDRRLLRALRDRLLRGLAMQNGDMIPGLQLVLSVDHDLFVRLESRIDQRLPITDLRDSDRAQGRGSVGTDDIRISALRTLLHDRRRDRQTIMPRIHQQSRVDEFARPQPMSRVREVRLQSY